MELGEYDHQAVEATARALWESHDIYRYDRDGVGGAGRRRLTSRRRICTSDMR
jgi:hypothetical protein